MLLPEFWHKGYGTAIVGKLLELCRESGYTMVSAITDPTNTYSRRIPERASFVFEKDFVNDDGDPAVIYLLELCDR